jgi:hypothetical protein
MHPFSIKFENLKYALGCALLTGGITLLVVGSHENGVKVGAEAMRNEVIKYVENIEKEQQ